MNTINFLKKIKKEGKLELVNPSEEMKQAYIVKSESNLISAKILLTSNRLEEAVGLAYYSMYHLLTALLFKIGIKSENHSISIILLKEVFNESNEEIFKAKTERIDKQYYVDFKITNEDVMDTIRKAEVFNSKLTDFISRLNHEDIELCRNKFMDLIKDWL